MCAVHLRQGYHPIQTAQPRNHRSPGFGLVIQWNLHMRDARVSEVVKGFEFRVKIGEFSDAEDLLDVLPHGL